MADTEAFVTAGIVDRCVRVRVERLDEDPGQYVTHATAMEDMLTAAGVMLQQVHHGDGVASWAANRFAIARGHGIRNDLEDATVLEEGG